MAEKFRLNLSDKLVVKKGRRIYHKFVAVVKLLVKWKTPKVVFCQQKLALSLHRVLNSGDSSKCHYYS